MATLTVIERMRKEQEELSIAIRVFERMSNSHRQNGAMRAAATALALPAANGNGRKVNKNRGKARGRVRLPEAAAPEGLSLKDTPLTDAIVLALQAIKKPIDARPLTSLLRAAGLTSADPRGVGVVASMLAKKKRGVRKTAKGYVAA